ncbi:hypothetical protein CVT26_015560 [Gymnopilus dilepis]|uniref:Uncharacterized protein n=1 Tax=Gymnopilus dilepis TaxID=231916 RepID=A0A409YDB2_9AGAR|nr:hypothetical protein CVT26_015560 [Gymnopilus dilepis]
MLVKCFSAQFVEDLQAQPSINLWDSGMALLPCHCSFLPEREAPSANDKEVLDPSSTLSLVITSLCYHVRLVLKLVPKFLTGYRCQKQFDDARPAYTDAMLATAPACVAIDAVAAHLGCMDSINDASSSQSMYFDQPTSTAAQAPSTTSIPRSGF